MSQSQSIYAVCWRDDKRLFEWAATWSQARALLDARIGDGSSEERIAKLIRQCSRFLYDEPICVGFGPDPRLHLPGVYRAIRVCPEQEPTVLAVIRRPGGFLVIAGPNDEVTRRLGRTKPNERYVLAQPVPEGERRPPSIARDTASAKRAMDVILAGEGIREHLLDLELGELIWFAQRGRRLRRQSPNIRLNQAISEAVAIALSIQRTSETLNLRAAELRDAHALDASRQVSLESIALCDSPEHNPYGYGGLAATLRRMRLYEEGDVAVKKALKHYPNEEPLLALRAAIIRDERNAPAPQPEEVT
jgi:hypothetical protein